MRKLKSVVFKQEYLEPEYRVHCKILDGGLEITRFGLSYSEKPDEETIKKDMIKIFEKHKPEIDKSTKREREVSIEFEY